MKQRKLRKTKTHDTLETYPIKQRNTIRSIMQRQRNKIHTRNKPNKTNKHEGHKQQHEHVTHNKT